MCTAFVHSSEKIGSFLKAALCAMLDFALIAFFIKTQFPLLIPFIRAILALEKV